MHNRETMEWDSYENRMYWNGNCYIFTFSSQNINQISLVRFTIFSSPENLGMINKPEYIWRAVGLIWYWNGSLLTQLKFQWAALYPSVGGAALLK